MCILPISLKICKSPTHQLMLLFFQYQKYWSLVSSSEIIEENFDFTHLFIHSFIQQKWKCTELMQCARFYARPGVFKDRMRHNLISPGTQYPILERCLGSHMLHSNWYFLVTCPRIALNSCYHFRKALEGLQGLCSLWGGITHVILISANGKEV